MKRRHRQVGDRRSVVVVGGGFGGLQAALHLARLPVDVTLIDRRNFHLFQPLAYQAATGALSPAEIATPLRRIFRRHANVRVLLAEVTDVDLDARLVQLRDVAGQRALEACRTTRSSSPRAPNTTTSVMTVGGCQPRI